MLAIVYSFILVLWWTVGGGGGERPVISITLPSSLPFLLIVVHPFVHNCSPQPSAAVKIKDSSFSFHKENTGHSLAKIMLFLPASGRSLFHLHVNCALGLFCANKSKLVKRIAVVQGRQSTLVEQKVHFWLGRNFRFNFALNCHKLCQGRFHSAEKIAFYYQKSALLLGRELQISKKDNKPCFCQQSFSFAWTDSRGFG